MNFSFFCELINIFLVVSLLSGVLMINLIKRQKHSENLAYYVKSDNWRSFMIMFRILVQIKMIINMYFIWLYSRYRNVSEELQLKSLTLVNSLTCSFKKLRGTLKYFLAKLFSVFWLHWNAPNYVQFQTKHIKAFLLVYKDSFASSETKLE